MIIEREPIVTGSTGEPDNSRLRPLLDALISRQIELFEVDSQNPNGVEAGINGIQELILEAVDQGALSEELEMLKRQAEIEVALAVISNPNEEFSRRQKVMAELANLDDEILRRDRVHFRSVAKVAKEAGLAVKLRLGDLGQIVNCLEANKIPVGRAQFVVQSGRNEGQILRYRVISIADEEAARQILAEEAAFANMRKSRIEPKTAA